jgi:Domain of unknown function (DUF4326)
MSTPAVVNRHHYHGKPLPELHPYIGRGTPLGNPFAKAEHGDNALRLYAVHIWDKVEDRDAEVLAALNSISPAHSLVCSCKPALCHGDVVIEVWEWLAGKGEW